MLKPEKKLNELASYRFYIYFFDNLKPLKGICSKKQILVTVKIDFKANKKYL